MTKLAVILTVSVMLAGILTGVIRAHDAKVEKRVEAEIVQASEKQGALNAAKSKKAYISARQPGAADRLRQDPATCVDCR